MATMTAEGRRVWVRTAYGEACVPALKALGAKWDPRRKEWWLGAAKRAQVEELLVGADRAAEEAPYEAPGQEDPHKVRVHAKVRYKGRTYYEATRAKDGGRVRLVSLPGADGKYLDFWADAREVTVERTYEPREAWDGRRYSGRTVLKYQTLGGLADFIARQKDPETRRVQCVECDAWHDAGEECRECGGC